MSIPSHYKNQVRGRLRTQRDIVLFSLPGDDEWHSDDEPGWSVVTSLFDSYESELPGATDTDMYLAAVAALRDEHRRRGGKTVLSRVIRGRMAPDRDLVDSAERYFDSNPSSFRALVSRKGVGIWIIATPELLLRTEGDTLHTMSLAGTRPSMSSGAWDPKNIEEQAMVTDYILERWQRLGLKPVAAEPCTLVSGAVEHICTHITAPWTGCLAVDDILDATAPTPSVSGLPRDEALKLIVQYETHQRGLYAGYIAVKHKNKTEAYVALRCARFTPDGEYAVYAGGGITADSEPDSELRETRMKSSALLSVLEDVRV